MKLAHFAVLFVLAVMMSSGMAEERGRGHDRDGPWRGEIHRFQDRDIGIWRGGHWAHGRHDGRLGWWWIVRGVWYFYPVAVYPYPDPYQPPVMTAPPPAPQYWYYCNNPAGYYPYVPECAAGWQKVPATPPTPAPPAYPR